MLALGLRETSPGLGGDACARRVVPGREGRKGENADKLCKDRKKGERELSSDCQAKKVWKMTTQSYALSAWADALDGTLPQILRSALFSITVHGDSGSHSGFGQGLPTRSTECSHFIGLIVYLKDSKAVTGTADHPKF